MKAFTEQDAPPEREGEVSPEPESENEGEMEPPPREDATGIDEDEPEEEAIEWDGSEAALVADDDAEEYEEPLTGIQLSFTLREEEIYTCLMQGKSGRFAGKRSVVEAVVLGLLACVFVWEYFWFGQQPSTLFFAAVALVFMLIVLFLPKKLLRKRARELATGREVYLEVYPDEIQVGKGEREWKIPLDGSCRRAEFSNLIALRWQNQLLVLPLRCVEPAVLAEVQAMIIAGTERDTGR